MAQETEMNESPFTEIFDLMESAVFIVTADDGKTKGGCTVVWTSRASFEPSYIALFIAPKRFTHDIIRNAGHFCLNIVGQKHIELARSFGLQSSYDVDKFAGMALDTSKAGAPILRDACAYIDCRLVQEFTVGDHTCFVGEVVAAERLSVEAPLIYKHTDYYPKEGRAGDSQSLS